MTRPTFLMCIGLPGSGKSTFAKRYYPNILHLENDMFFDGGSVNVDRIKRSEGLARFEELLGGSVHKHNVITLGFYDNTKEFCS